MVSPTQRAHFAQMFYIFDIQHISASVFSLYIPRNRNRRQLTPGQRIAPANEPVDAH